MKKTTLCQISLLLSAFPFLAHAAEIYNKDQNVLDLYGRVDGLHYFSDNTASDGDMSYARLGFKGQTQINDNVVGYGQWEYQLNANTAENEDSTSFTRFGFVGLSFGKYGSVDYGRNSGIIYDVMSWTDMQPEFDGSTVGPDEFMFQRANGVLTWHNSDFFGLVDGLNLGLQYQGKNDSLTEDVNDRDVLGQNGDGYGMSMIYDLGGGVSVGGAMFSSDRTDDQNGGSGNGNIIGRGDKAEAYTGGLKFQSDRFVISADYTQSYNAIRFGSANDSAAWGYANEARGAEVYTGYTFDSGLQPFVGWNYVEGINLGGDTTSMKNYGTQKLVNFIDLGTSWFFNKNMSAYVDYKINLLDENSFTRDSGINTDNVIATGLVYQF